MEKYPSLQDAIKNYPSLEEILSNPIAASTDNLKFLFSSMDFTSLDVTDHPGKIKAMCTQLNSFATDFPDMPPVASICVFPSLVDTVKATLQVRKTGITSVAGGFPSSQTEIEVKELETEIAILDGATEIDIVLSVGKFLHGHSKEAGHEILEIKKLCRKALLKVILETGCLPSQESVYQASMLALESGADFIKTSTGKLQPAATPEAVYTMCIALNEYYKVSGTKKGLKAAGGIVTAEDALKYLTIVQAILGNDWITPKLFRLGASRLANNLLEAIANLENKEFRPYFS